MTILTRLDVRRQRAPAACSIILVLLVTQLIGSAWSDEPTPGEERLEALAKRYTTESTRVYADAEKVTDVEERDRLFRERDPANTMFAEFLKLEEQHRGSLVGLSALHHLVSIAFGGYGGRPEFPVTDGGRQALEVLARAVAKLVEAAEQAP